jgi:hypothetical protein
VGLAEILSKIGRSVNPFYLAFCIQETMFLVASSVHMLPSSVAFSFVA